MLPDESKIALEMSDNGGMYEFGHFVLDVEQRSFTKDGQRISLKPKTFDVLTVLLQRANRAASKDEIIRAVLHDSFVEEGNLAVHISTLRKIFSANSDRNIYIETVPKMGYRLITERSAADAVSDATDQGQDAENPSAPIPQVPKGRSRRTAWTIFFTGMVVGILAAGSVAYYSVRLNFGPKMHGSFNTVECPRDAQRSNLVGGGCEEAVAAFAVTANPNGNWSYGYTPRDDLSAFALFDRAVSKHFGSPEVPSDSWSRTDDWLPSILRNTTPYTVVIQHGVVVPPHMFEMHPGPNGERSVLRWTAPMKAP